MATAAQTSANRLNARKSTGPRTPEGKAVVSQNAVKHGLLARAAVLQGEDPEEFAEYREQLLEELGAEGTLEATVAERIVGLSWRQQRVARSQNAAFETLYDKQAAWAPKGSVGLGPGIAADNGPILGQMLVTDFANTRVLERLLVYERRIESSLLRMMAELRRQQRLRRDTISSTARAMDSGEPAWGERACSFEEVGRGRPTHEEPPDGGTTNNEVPGSKCGVSSEESQTANPASLPTSYFLLHSASVSGATKPKEAASGKRQVASEQGRVSGPLSLATSNFTLQTAGGPPYSESCETKPICGESSFGQVPCGTGVGNDLPGDEICETKPMCEGPGDTPAVGVLRRSCALGQ